MPGLVGVVGSGGPELIGAVLSEMAQAVRHHPWYRVTLHQEPGCGLGRVSLGHEPDPEQPVWDPGGRVALWMEGELYNGPALRQRLAAQGFPAPVESDADLLLRLYLAEGEGFAALLNGAFAIAIWDRRSRTLLLATDRFGSYPIYYARVGDRLLFAPNVHGLLADPDLPRTVDEGAIAQALTFDHILGDRTWLKAVRLAPAASLLRFHDGQLTVRPYWDLRYPAYYEIRDEDEYVEEFVHLLRQAVARQHRGERAAGMLLSGGLDSRVLLAAMRDGPLVDPLYAFTWGIPGCDDARFAREAAAVVGAQHHFFELQPDYLRHKAEEGVRLTNGANCIHYHALANLEAQSQHTGVIYKGVMGDAMMGTALTRPFWAQYDRETLPWAHFKMHHDRGVLLFTPAEQEELFSPDFQRQVGDAVMADYTAGMLASQAEQMADQRIYFDLRQRVPRMTWNGVELVRSRARVRIPYCDNDVVDFALHLPPGFRFERYLLKKVLVAVYPNLAQIPYTETNLPLRACARDVIIRAQRLAAWHLHRLGLRRSPDIPRRPYARYDQWFRTELRDWVSDILLDERTLSRGYFQPETIRRLVSEQMAGARHAVKLGALISLELWHRQFLEAPSARSAPIPAAREASPLPA
ncbi:MAG: hypothetical protein KatS3mg050_0893 [Litorilinea sp.]|nr:MAG: hypothetical protein KatS3mg050_0893 [Litorilinea sp.]